MLFESTSNSRWFANSTVVLLFNKIDLLEAKLSKSSLKVRPPPTRAPAAIANVAQAMMPSYVGDDLSFHSALEFFQQSFTSVYRQKRPLYVSAVHRRFSHEADVWSTAPLYHGDRHANRSGCDFHCVGEHYEDHVREGGAVVKATDLSCCNRVPQAGHDVLFTDTTV